MMISTIELLKQEDIGSAVSVIRSRTAVPPSTVNEVQLIIDAVRENGDEALVRLTSQYDRINLAASDLEVTPDERKTAWEDLQEETKAALIKAEGRISSFARASLQPDWMSEESPGLSVGQTHRPFDTVGIYLPGGRYPYPSTALMTGVLAREAGVLNIVFCAPPGATEKVDASTLAATTLVGECRVFKAGGAQAIAAMAYGTETIPRCAMIAGPGNVYVATAKRLVSNIASVDLDAGPSEVAVYLDGSVDVSYPAADALAQLEHDPFAIAVIVSESSDVLESVGGLISGLTESYGGENNTDLNITLVHSGSRGLAIDFLNALAPEHLELMVEGAYDLIGEIRSAGCVLVGPYSAVALGDYVAGPSHVLPTGGTAARLSGLKADDFRRTMNIISYTKGGFESDAPAAGLIARLEGLRNHSMSLDIRMRGSAKR
jgi:histidinol dehydrogenase